MARKPSKAFFIKYILACLLTVFKSWIWTFPKTICLNPDKTIITNMIHPLRHVLQNTSPIEMIANTT